MAEVMALSYGADDMYCEFPVGAAAVAANGSAEQTGARAGARANQPLSVRAGISLARAGDMDLAKRALLPSRANLFSALGVGQGRVFAVRQVHSREVVLVDGQGPGSLESVEADGMITARRDALLTVTVADCLPIFLSDPASGALGLVHSGWKGTGIVLEAVSQMTARFGSRPRDLRATIGPGIGPCCYRVPEERCRRFAAAFGEDAVARVGEGDCRLDLRRANVALLRGVGVEDIVVISDCTCCSPALGSFRREGPAGFTRMLAYLGSRQE